MKRFNLMMTAVLLMTSSLALAAPEDKTGPARWNGKDESTARTEFARRARLKYVVEIAEALDLNEAEALKLSDKIKGIEDRRQPIRQEMREAMKAVKAAADGDTSALSQVDANIQKVLDGRAQMAVMDKELFTLLAKDLSPAQRAKLAVVLAKIHGEGKKGRHAHR